jgi:hypothetical protein
MHKNATKCNETLSKLYKNKHGASKIIDTFETYQYALACFEALMLAEEMYMTRMLVASDFLNIIKDINGSRECQHCMIAKRNPKTTCQETNPSLSHDHCKRKTLACDGSGLTTQYIGDNYIMSLS